MAIETSQKLCPKCSSIISEDAPGGLCPHCLMQFVAMSTGGADFPLGDRSPPELETIRSAFPQLEILELIGQGGMGAVYKARQPKLDRIVALKILPIRLAREPLFAERFEREGRLLARLNHPNIVGVYDYGQAGGLYYLIMEYVDGVNLRQAFASARFTPQQALSVIPKICEALQFAHDEGVLHRDIKPENILLDTKGRVKIADFGIAKFAGVDDKTGLTATGATIGTPHYMAPEQVERPADVDHRADIFSLGVVFYEMLTGELPLGRFSAPSERTISLDARIDKVVMRALEKDRERRQQSANEVRTQVEFLSGNSISQSKRNDSTVAKPPILHGAAASPRYSARPTFAIGLIVASILLPPLIALQYNGPSDRLLSSLVLLLIWLGLPGTILGLFHLHYLRRSGNRNGLKTAVVAAFLWPSILAMGWCVYWMTKLDTMASLNSKGLAIRLLNVGWLALLFALVALFYFGFRMIAKKVAQKPPDPAFLPDKPTSIETLITFFVKAVVFSIWFFVGLVILFMFPGTPRQTVVAPNYVNPKSVQSTELQLEVTNVTTKENVLILVVKKGRTTSFGGKMYRDEMYRDEMYGGKMGGLESEGVGMSGEMVTSTDVEFRIEFRGASLSPRSEVLATESYPGHCFFPGEETEILTFSLRQDETATLAFALPDRETAVACKNKMERLNTRMNQDASRLQWSNVAVLFRINSGAFGDYEAHAIRANR